MRVSAPAKINLHLRVGRRRDDGFHPLLTWMCTIGLFDNLTFVRRQIREDDVANEKASGAFDFSLQCDRPELPVDGRNLVVRVAAALADTLSRVGEGPAGRRERVSAYLSKRIPVGAGLAGGSSDAAATLKVMSAMWKVDWDAQQMADFAAQFGSDVPFFFHGPSSVCGGRGEIVRPIGPPAVKYAVLVMPAVEVSTAEVYRRFDEMDLGDDSAIAQEPPWQDWTKLAADELLPQLVNDLERPTFAMKPELDELRKSLEGRWNKIVRMSGSGSSLFTLCDDEENANVLATAAQRDLRVGAMTVRTGV